MRFKHLIILTTVFIFLLSFSFLTADDSDCCPKFVDLDGDGFDDNAADDDNNSIPDQAEPEAEPEDAGKSGQCSNTSLLTSFQVPSKVDLSQFLSNSEKFGERAFSTRAQSCFRGGFDAGDKFGFGNGIGSAAVTGGCPGGVCR